MSPMTKTESLSLIEISVLESSSETRDIFEGWETNDVVGLLEPGWLAPGHPVGAPRALVYQ